MGTKRTQQKTEGPKTTVKTIMVQIETMECLFSFIMPLHCCIDVIKINLRTIGESFDGKRYCFVSPQLIPCIFVFSDFEKLLYNVILRFNFMCYQIGSCFEMSRDCCFCLNNYNMYCNRHSFVFLVLLIPVFVVWVSEPHHKSDVTVK